MATTTIEWTDAVWNPVTGCTKVSAGCDHCYAEGVAKRFWPTQYEPNPDGSARRFEDVRVHEDRLEQPFRWHRPRLVFVNSMSDLFHADVPRDFIAQVFAVMALTPLHTYQILTKRPGRMRALLTDPAFGALVEEHAGEAWITPCGEPMVPLENVWLGVSVENQEHAEKRIPPLLETPAAVRWLSCEPLLGPIDLSEWMRPCLCSYNEQSDVGADGLAVPFHWGVCSVLTEGIDWLVAGGEFGAGARPCHPNWLRDLRDQCEKSGVPFFFKQWGAWAPVAHGPRDGDVWVFDDGSHFYEDDDKTIRSQWKPEEGRLLVWPSEYQRPAARIMRRVGKAAAGRELDGRTWDEMPGGDA